MTTQPTLPHTLQIISGNGGQWIWLPNPKPEPDETYSSPLPVAVIRETVPVTPEPVAWRSEPTGEQISLLCHSILNFLVRTGRVPVGAQA